MVPSWADQLLPQLLMEQFDTLPMQCRHIEHKHEGVWFRKIIFDKNDSCENLDNFSDKGFDMAFVYWSAKSQILSSVAPPRKKKLVTIFSQGHV